MIINKQICTAVGNPSVVHIGKKPHSQKKKNPLGIVIYCYFSDLQSILFSNITMIKATYRMRHDTITQALYRKNILDSTRKVSFSLCLSLHFISSLVILPLFVHSSMQLYFTKGVMWSVDMNTKMLGSFLKKGDINWTRNCKVTLSVTRKVVRYADRPTVLIISVMLLWVLKKTGIKSLFSFSVVFKEKL